jgi:glycosyltransferase involved in cell wall biosynthesis
MSTHSHFLQKPSTVQGVRLASSQPKRVLFFEHNTDNTVGGSHYCLLEICRYIDRKRFTPIACFAQENSLFDDFRATGAEIVIEPALPPVHLAPSAYLPRRVVGPLQSAANAWRTLVTGSNRWMKRLQALRVDAVHLNNSCGGDHDLVAAAMRLKLPVIAHQRGYPQEIGAIERWFARRLDSIISISNSVTEDLRRQGLFGDNLTLVYDGIDPERVIARADGASVRSRFNIPADAGVVGVVGNVKAWKGQDTLIRAMRHVVAKWPDTRCLVVGSNADPSYMEKLQQHVAEADLGERVIFTGYERYPAACMAAMDVVVHTSTAPEPFGLVVLEGMALRKPVIATAHGGPVDIVVHEESGFLTPADDEMTLASVINRLLADDTLRRRVGEAGFRRLNERFTARHNIAGIEAVYDSLFARETRHSHTG